MFSSGIIYCVHFDAVVRVRIRDKKGILISSTTKALINLYDRSGVGIREKEKNYIVLGVICAKDSHCFLLINPNRCNLCIIV